MLKVENLKCGYGTKDIIKGISFKLDDGERLSIIGPNGCGKTTLLRSLCGLLSYKGSAKIDDKEISKMKRRELSSRVAYLSQLSQNYFSYSVYETVKMARYVHSKSRLYDSSEKDVAVVNRCLSELGLTSIRDCSITELSGGQLQRVYLARAFAQEPDIIMLDEPTNHLDLKYRIELLEILKQWSADKKHSVLGVIHDLNLAAQLADRAILMNEGEIIADSSVPELIASQALTQAYGVDVKSFMQSSLKLWE